MRRIIILFALGVALILTSLWWTKSFNEEKVQSRTKKPTVIHFWGIDDHSKVYEPFIKEFESAHPGVAIQYKQFSSPSEAQSLIDARLVQKQGPDIFATSKTWLDNNKGLVVSTKVADLSDFAPLVQHELQSNGELYGLPLSVDSLAIYYNSRFYPEGISPTWSELAEQTRTIKRSGIALGRTDNITYGWDTLEAWFLQNDINLGRTDKEQLEATLSFFVEFAYPASRYYNWSPRLTIDNPELELDTFLQGRVAAIIGYRGLYEKLLTKSWQYDQLNKPHIDTGLIRVAKLPQFNSSAPASRAHYSPLVVSKYSAHPQLAWEFIQFLSSKENMYLYSQMTGKAPSRTDVELEDATEEWQIFKSQVSTSKSYHLSPSQREKIKEVLDLSYKNRNFVTRIKQIQF